MLLDNAPELCHGGNVRSAGFSLLRVEGARFFWLQPVEVRSTALACRYIPYQACILGYLQMGTYKTQIHKGSLRVFYCPEAAECFEAERGEAGFRVGLSREESLHAAKVLRLAVGDEVRLFDGKGFFYDGEIASVVRNEVQARIASRAASNVDPRTRLVLLVALLKGRKADFLIQKAVELGVGEIVFFQARRSVSQARATDADGDEEGSGRDRWEKIVVSACKQCGRATLMPVRELPDLNAALRALPHTPIRYVFWEALSQAADTHTADTQAADTQASPATQEPPATPKPAAQEPAATQEPAARFPDVRAASAEIIAMIGPEGGFTQEEIDRVLAAGFRACSLGPRILRAETAALAAATILLHQAGELGADTMMNDER